MRKSPLLRGKPRKKPPRTNSPSAATRVACSTTTAKNDDALGIRFRRTPSDHEVDGCRRYARKLGYLGNRERRAALSKDSAPPPTPPGDGAESVWWPLTTTWSKYGLITSVTHA